MHPALLCDVISSSIGEYKAEFDESVGDCKIKNGRLVPSVFFITQTERNAALSAVRASNVRNERINKRAKTYRRCDALATGENIA